MKKPKIQLFTIIFAFLFLVCLVVIQVNWIFQTAKMKQDLFNKSVNMALSSTVDNISKDYVICQNVKNCFGSDSTSSCCERFNRINWSKVNSMIKEDLEACNIDLDFEFDIVDLKENIRICEVNEIADKPYYFHSLEEALQESGIHLQVKFPGEKEFRIAQIGPMFITAIVLIILVMISFIMILYYYNKEKKIAEKTRDFINNMTHEFKTPLANISFANNLLRKRESHHLSDRANRYVEIIRDENIKLQGQLEELLKINELGDTEIRSDVEPCDIHKIIEEAIRSMDMQISERGGKIESAFTAENPKIVVNQAHLRNVITNLLDNANKYSGETPEIKISTYSKSNNLIIEVEDKGIGIRHEHLEYIFDKFYRAPSGDITQASGVGLGLTYVKMVMDAIGGRIDVSSTPGKGSTFKLILPVRPADVG